MYVKRNLPFYKIFAVALIVAGLTTNKKNVIKKQFLYIFIILSFIFIFFSFGLLSFRSVAVVVVACAMYACVWM